MPHTLIRCAPLAATMALVACTQSNPGFIAGEPCAAAPQVCTAGTVCDPQAQICTCPAGRAVCGERCAELATDTANCGGCGLVCPPGDGCAEGRCSSGGCPAGALECDGRCVDPQTNPRHCGGCRDQGGERCGDGEPCVDGRCRASRCPFGATECGGRCVDLHSAAESCGACGHACAPDQLCAAGRCVSACPAELARCGSACVDLAFDPTHCGRCDESCERGELCAIADGRPRCREYAFAACATCPCEACGERSCCLLAAPEGGVQALCVEGRCPTRAR